MTRRIALVITALAAGVAMVTQTAGTILSNKDAILAWVDETFAADLFLSSGSPISEARARLAKMNRHSGSCAMAIAIGARSMMTWRECRR